MSTGKHYDLKVGYGCNNNCFHCVIEPQVETLLKKNGDINQSYSEIIEYINSKEFSEADTITITGGEVTIRKEFMRILRYIVDKYPTKSISIQTNGRRLKEYVEAINQLSNKIIFTVALHSTNEKLHNEITGNRNGNPFRETWESLEEIKRVYKDFKNTGHRIEIVLSSLNVDDLYHSIVELYNNDIKFIGISYPHLDGKFERDKESTKKIGFSYDKLRDILPPIYEFARDHHDLRLAFEEVPLCMWRDVNGNLYKRISNLENMDGGDQESVTVRFPDYTQNDFLTLYKQMHRQASKCRDCVLCCNCLGVWYEAIEMYGDLGFKPITKEEIEEIGGMLECTC